MTDDFIVFMHNIYVLHIEIERREKREATICTRNYKWMHVPVMNTGNVFGVRCAIDAYTNVERISIDFDRLIFAIISGDRRNGRVAATKLTKKTLISYAIDV